jgi:hypothetical protein
MSKSFLRTTLTLAGTVAMFIPGIGTIAKIGITLGLAVLNATLLAPNKAKTSPSAVNRLQASLVPTQPREFVFGTTALATDVRYQAPTGTNQEYIDQIVAVASHQVQSIDEIWFDNVKAWSLSGGVTATYAGYLTVDVRNPGTSSNGIAIDSVWTASCRLTGCAYLHLRYKTTGASSKATSPFSSSIPSRMTIRGSGALVYDPRFDSTVAGGSGSQRANDQTTWAFAPSGVASGRNPALQLLWYLLGWKIQDPAALTWKLAVGKGIPPARLDLPSFITAANICDETVTLAVGGTEPRYRADGVFSEGDDPSTVVQGLLAATNGWLDDGGGKIALNVYKNDLATPALTLTGADILGNELWQQTPSIDQMPNIGRGRYVDPSDTSLYQLVDYPEVRLTSVDGIDRIDSTDYAVVQSPSQVQRLQKQKLQRLQFPGRYSANFGPRAWRLTRGKVVQLSHPGMGWTNKLFRVVTISLGTSGVVAMTLAEEDASIYAWAASELPAVTGGTPTVYNQLNNPLVAGITAATSTIYRQATNPAATAQDGDIWIDTSVTPNIARARIAGAWQVAANYVTQGTDIGVANGATKNTLYRQSSAPSAPIDGDAWIDTSVTPNLTKFRVAGAWQIGANYVTSGPDIGVAAGATKGRNLILNPGAETGAVLPWRVDNALTAAGGLTWTGSLGVDATAPATGKYRFLVTKGATSEGVAILQPAIELTPGKQYLVRWGSIQGVSSSAAGLFLRVNEAAALPADGYIDYNDVGGGGAGTTHDLTTTDGLTTANTAFSISPAKKECLYTAPAGVRFGSPTIIGWVGGPTFAFDDVEFYELTDTELNADVTRILVPDSAQVIQYDYTGSTSAQLPKILTNKMEAGGSNVTPSTSFSYSASGCTVDTTGCLTGQVRLTAVTATNAEIGVSATYGGVPRTGTIPVQRVLGDNPGGAGGGGSGATGFSVDVSGSITDTSYSTPQTLISPSAQMVSNASGQIRLTLNAEYEASPNQTAQVTAKAQKSLNNTTWTDAGLSATGTTATGSYWNDTNGNGILEVGETVAGVTGSITANSLVGGFTASTAYYIRWIAFKSGGTTSVGVSGTASGAQS